MGYQSCVAGDISVVESEISGVQGCYRLIAWSAVEDMCVIRMSKRSKITWCRKSDAFPLLNYIMDKNNGRSRRAAHPIPLDRDNFFSVSCVPLALRVGTPSPPHGESWIRHCQLITLNIWCQFSQHRLLQFNFHQRHFGQKLVSYNLTHKVSWQCMCVKYVNCSI